MINDNFIEILKNIKLLRKEMGLTQEEFAKKIGISRRAYLNIEKYGSYPRLKVAEKISKIVNESGVLNKIIEDGDNGGIKNNIKFNKIDRLQSILRTIRFILKINSEEFGNLFGLTRQTISNYELGNINMPMIMYISIRSVLDRINEPMINDLIEVIIDNPEKYDDAENIAFTIDLFAKAMHAGAKKELIKYIPMEYTKYDWMGEIINIK